MSKKKNNNLSVNIAAFFSVLSVLVVIAGIALAAVGFIDMRGLSEIDANSFLHEPTIYFNELRHIMNDSIYEVVAGVCVILFGSIIFSLAFSRFLALKSEGVKIIALEERVEKLEKAKN